MTQTGKILRNGLFLFIGGGILFCATYWGTYVGYSMFQVPWLLKLFIFYSLVVATYTMEYWWLAFPLYAGYVTLCLKYKAFSIRFVQYFWLILLLDIVAWIVSFIVPFGQSTDYVMGRIAYRVHYSQNEFAYTLIMIACVFPSCVLLAKLCSFLANFKAAEKQTSVETSLPGGVGERRSLSSLLTAHSSQKEILEKALKWDPENVSLIRTLGKIYFQEDKTGKALEIFEKIAASGQAQPPDYRMLGTLYARMDKFDEKSFHVFQTVLQNEPLLAEFHLYLAKCYFTMKKFDEALEILETTTAVRDTKSLEFVADVLFEKGRYEEAEKILSELIQNARNEKLLFKHAKVLMKKSELDAAIVLLQKTARFPEYEPESAYYLAQCFLQKELPDIAIRRFQRALELQRNGEREKDIYYHLGLCWEKKGDAVKAKDMYRKVVLMDFSFKDVKARFEKLAKPDKAWLDEALTGEINVDINEQAKLRYKILSEIGRGGMGIVYKARDTFLERTVALKVLHDDLNASPNAVKRFITEAKAAAALNHPNIINIYDVGEEKGRKFISMEYIDSGSLRDKIEKGINDDEIEKILKQVCSALLFAHSKGIIHRDIKPDNVLLTKEGITKITDFGIAKIHAESREIFKTSSIVGTPLYISPEQINGEEADVRTDIYSLGALLYEILTGKPPFTRGDIYYQHLHIEPQDPSLQRENVPELLKSIALKCLQKKKEDRFPSVENILKQLAS